MKMKKENQQKIIMMRVKIIMIKIVLVIQTIVLKNQKRLIKITWIKSKKR